ncbi:ComF family protein [Streptococcus equi]|uniref:ComF family protein n=1 Tax=Streptococcus equi TaxID=1336 RepID=UPI001E41EA2B|nr:hypothetical protein [Streptococcus equi]
MRAPARIVLPGKGKAIRLIIKPLPYNTAMKDYFSRYKFQGDYVLRSLFAQELAKHIKKYYKAYTLVPVPVSKQRYDERGFNQVTAILEYANLAYLDLLSESTILDNQAKRKKNACS